MDFKKERNPVEGGGCYKVTLVSSPRTLWIAHGKTAALHESQAGLRRRLPGALRRRSVGCLVDDRRALQAGGSPCTPTALLGARRRAVRQRAAWTTAACLALEAISEPTAHPRPLRRLGFPPLRRQHPCPRRPHPRRRLRPHRVVAKASAIPRFTSWRRSSHPSSCASAYLTGTCGSTVHRTRYCRRPVGPRARTTATTKPFPLGSSPFGPGWASRVQGARGRRAFPSR